MRVLIAFVVEMFTRETQDRTLHYGVVVVGGGECDWKK